MSLCPEHLPASVSTVEEALKFTIGVFINSRESACASFAAKGLEPHTGPLPEGESDEDNLDKKRANYQWELWGGGFVPQCKVDEKTFVGYIPKTSILDMSRAPNDNLMHLVPVTLTSIAAIEEDNRAKHADQKTIDLYDAENVGLRSDWFTDAVFGQQQFTGVNPATITLLTDDSFLDHFVSAAEAQSNEAVAKLMRSHYHDKQLYIQDCSYYRRAAGMGADDELRQDDMLKMGTAYVKVGDRYAGASVVLFSLASDGKPHPLAITLDYKGTSSSRVTIINKRLSTSDTAHDEKSDWPWRYAKMCAQASDWSRHEMAVHLTNTHLIEEAIIVAAQRTLPDRHILLQVLNAHWTTTLSLNSLAKGMLVPQLIQPCSPFSIPQVVSFLQHARSTYDFAASYVPIDLEKRGFPIHELEKPTGKFHNYTYARQVYKMWTTIREYVSSIVNQYYLHDAAVRADTELANFVAEVRGGDGKTIPGGNLPLFPIVDTLEGLIDMVTMCIHIAAPQHTAVNYLQQFYLSFIPNRPGSLFSPLPQSLSELQNYGEKELVAALPLHGGTSVKWMMMAQVPYLLSKEVDPNQNILAYADQVSEHWNPIVAEAGKSLRHKIGGLVHSFKEMSSQNDDKETEYKVLYPDLMASAIII